MSRLDHPLSEIYSGTHLVVVLEASLLRDKDNLPIIAKDGSKGINIRFNDNKLNHDKVFWEKSSDFRKLCKITSCDMTKPVLPQLKGKSLWLCIKEVKTMKEAVHVSSEYVAFDYIECTNPTQKPIISGDPCQHPKGLPLGVFVEYKQYEMVAGEEFLVSYGKVQPLQVVAFNEGKFTTENPSVAERLKAIHSDKGIPLDFDSTAENVAKAVGNIKDKIALGRKIIAEGEGKKMTSLNEKKSAQEESSTDIFEKAESHGESNDNNHVEDDWGDL